LSNSKNSPASISLRYFILLIVAIPNLWIFYKIFTPLTVYPVYLLLNLFYDAQIVSGNIVLISQIIPIEIIGSCVAGSAYYLLLMLNLFTPEIKTKKRISMIILAFIAFLIINILRIFFLSLLAISDSAFFDITHKLFWYLMSTIFVVGIWFWQVKKYKIKEIPLYSDIKYIKSLTSKR